MGAVPPSTHRRHFCGHHVLFLVFTAYVLLSVATEMPRVSVTMETTGDSSNYVGLGTSWKCWRSGGSFFMFLYASAIPIKFSQKHKVWML